MVRLISPRRESYVTDEEEWKKKKIVYFLLLHFWTTVQCKLEMLKLTTIKKKLKMLLVWGWMRVWEGAVASGVRRHEWWWHRGVREDYFYTIHFDMFWDLFLCISYLLIFFINSQFQTFCTTLENSKCGSTSN